MSSDFRVLRWRLTQSAPKSSSKPENFLKIALTSDLDKLIAGVLTAWVKTGAGDPKRAWIIWAR
jgi:hypothetical protein